jgi:predicted nucleic acid-binding protein
VRSVPDALVVDAGILISAVLGRSTALVETVGERVTLITSDRAFEEATRRVALGMGRPDLLPALAALAEQLEVIPVTRLATAPAALVLRDASQSRNGSTTDAHLLALAWEANADVWRHDRDFAGTGVASWSLVNLARALDDRTGEPDV